jgi:hypothetical protein
MITADQIRAIALGLPRSYEALVGDRIKFKVGRIVYLSLSPDETVMGFAYPKEQRAALIAAEPAKFHMPVRSDERYNWVRVRLAALDDEIELRELIVDAWCMAVPKSVAAQYLTTTGSPVDLHPAGQRQLPRGESACPA